MKAKSLKSIDKYISYNPESGEFFWLQDKARATKGSPAGCPDDLGYLKIQFNGKKIKGHRLAYILMGEEVPDVVDHIDGDPSNNKWDNLRGCTTAENQWNSKLSKINTSGFKGVSYFKPRGTWIARLTVDKKRTTIGYYKTPEEANEALIKYREEQHGSFCNHGVTI